MAVPSHDALRHPVLSRTVLSPNEMWAALLGVCGYVPLPLSGRDYLALLPVRWCAITGRGIRIDHRTYDDAVLNEHRGQSSGIPLRGGKWEVHHNPTIYGRSGYGCPTAAWPKCRGSTATTSTNPSANKPGGS
ncbi:hypothetical protein [Streptomyces sp. TLI_146]|uniref:hypothetical protein n=1 Tax=Streptomyces sp. TLI_146 TaxID=1938858 RepID=UPI00214AFAB2|nr:hypothetical protein [Streptomyces sp. TLI_146]